MHQVIFIQHYNILRQKQLSTYKILNQCSKYAVLSELYCNEIVSNSWRPNVYEKWLSESNFKGIDFPVKIKDITKIEIRMIVLQ